MTLLTFDMKRFELDNKKDWFKVRESIYRGIITDSSIELEDRLFCQKMKNTVIYESPKTFVDGVAYNDGTWVKFHTFRTKKGGKLVGNIRVMGVNDLLRTIYSYMVFLRMTGIENEKLLVYFSAMFFDRLTYPKGMFPSNNDNIRRLLELARRVLKRSKEDLTKDWTRDESEQRVGCWDDREFCLETSGMTRSEATKMQNKVMDKKKRLDEQIEKFYDQDKSIAENLDILHSNGVKVGKSRFCLWLKDHKTKAVQNGPLISEDRPSKTDRSMDDSDANRLSKTVYNYHIHSSNGAAWQQPQCNDKKKRIDNEQPTDYVSFITKEEIEMINKDNERERRRQERRSMIEDDFLF